MKWCTFFFAALTVAALGQTAQADKVSKQIARLEVGVICAPPNVGETPAPGTVAGTTHLIDVEPAFVSLTRRVPAVVGMGFGVKAQSRDAAGLPDVTITITHPPMGKSATTSQTFQSRISGLDLSLTFYQFDFDYELVLGIWHLEARQGSDLLYSTTFNVVPPSKIPELATICGYQDLLS